MASALSKEAQDEYHLRKPSSKTSSQASTFQDRALPGPLSRSISPSPSRSLLPSPSLTSDLELRDMVVDLIKEKEELRKELEEVKKGLEEVKKELADFQSKVKDLIENNPKKKQQQTSRPKRRLSDVDEVIPETKIYWLRPRDTEEGYGYPYYVFIREGRETIYMSPKELIEWANGQFDHLNRCRYGPHVIKQKPCIKEKAIKKKEHLEEAYTYRCGVVGCDEVGGGTKIRTHLVKEHDPIKYCEADETLVEDANVKNRLFRRLPQVSLACTFREEDFEWEGHEKIPCCCDTT